MARRLWFAVSLGLFLLGAGSLAFTAWLWFGEWPRQAKETVEHFRSLAENAGRPPEPLIGGVRGRRVRKLNGTWQALIDPGDRGALGGLAPLAWEPEAPADHGEFSFENGLELAVPGDWNTQDPRLVFYQGVVWYKREFRHAPDANERTFLWLGAANHRAALYLNGKLLGEHTGGFTPFNFEITHELQEGENLLVIKVDNRHGDDDIPTPTTDWLNYGGLTRDILLVSVPPTFVRNWKLGLEPAKPGRLRGWVDIDGGEPGTSVRLAIEELSLDVELATDAAGRATIDLPLPPGTQLWSPAKPKLYDVEWHSGDDRVPDRIGFRTLAVRGEALLLNGAPIRLRGVSLHEEVPYGAGRAHSAEHAEVLLGWVRELNGNFARLAHYPHSEHMSRRADELGILLWEEIPVYWDIAFDDAVSLERGKRQLSELIARDQNRASVAFWSIGNETPVSDARLAFMTALEEHVKSLDTTRLTTAALLSGSELLGPFLARYFLPALLGWSPTTWTFRVDDPLGKIVDVPALNEYFGWYYSGVIGLLTPFSSRWAREVMLENIPRIELAFEVAKPVIVSEFGAGAKAGLHADPESYTAYSEELQARVYEQQLAMLERQPAVVGISPWVLKDFRSPLRLYQGVQDYWNRKGLVSDSGERKLAFAVLRDWYAERADAPATH